MGCRGLVDLFRSADGVLSSGAEVYLNAAGTGAGVSTGLRYVSGNHALSTLTFSPIMGHLSTTHSAQVLPGLIASAKYDYNIYSWDADLSVGMEFSPSERLQKLKIRFGGQGVAARFEGQFGRLNISVGVGFSLYDDSIRTVGARFLLI